MINQPRASGFCRSSLTDFGQTVALINEAVEQLASPARVLTPYKLKYVLFDVREGKQFAGPASLAREIISEEICAMILPALLDGGEKYIRYAELWHEAHKLEFERGLLEEKLEILKKSRYARYLTQELPSAYGFIAYPAHALHSPKDYLTLFPGRSSAYLRYAYPVIYEIEGLQDRITGRPIPGWFCISYARPAQMRDQQQLMREKIGESVMAVERLGSILTGLGGLTASATDGGRYLFDNFSQRITTGHGYTIANITNVLQEAANAVGLALSDAVVAVVGAAGSVGSGVARLCAQRGVSKLILVDTRAVDSLTTCIQQDWEVEVAVASDPKVVREADVALVATSASRALFAPDDFRPGAIIIDDSQPKNVDPGLLDSRNDILVLEGGVSKLPARFSFSIRPAFGPKLRDFQWTRLNLPMTGENEVPCCLAEVLLWTELRERREQYSLGRADPELALYLADAGAYLGYGPGNLQSFGANVQRKRLRKVRSLYEKMVPE